ncbi:hypothetical protein AB9K26_07000 [Psychroserpens sp. XS_ASV72]|uniref:hypothetical protein n=1 Tax=Psychroserpens sp. XS_ASV72 TaxID=3241293 RepID=UPI003511366E
MRFLKNILLFQRKIVFISYAIAVLIGLVFGGDLKVIGLIFLCVSPFVHFFFYEVKNKNQYYYYYNLGLTNTKLWISTVVFGIINVLILAII